MKTKDKITPSLMFDGKAEEAINFYTSLFKDAEIKEINRYGDGEQDKKGSVKAALFSLNGSEYRAIDSPVEYDFTFTPSVSLFVQCDTEKELQQLFKKLSENGEILMPLDNYEFSSKFGWINDCYGVSWQLNLQ